MKLQQSHQSKRRKTSSSKRQKNESKAHRCSFWNLTRRVRRSFRASEAVKLQVNRTRRKSKIKKRTTSNQAKSSFPKSTSGSSLSIQTMRTCARSDRMKSKTLRISMRTAKSFNRLKMESRALELRTKTLLRSKTQTTDSSVLFSKSCDLRLVKIRAKIRGPWFLFITLATLQ